MKEMINVLVGGCGNRLGTNFWKSIMREHNINVNTGEKIEGGVDQHNESIVGENLDIFLEEKEENKHVPRVLMADLGNETIESLLVNEKLLTSDCAIFGTNGGSHNFATGLYTEGHVIIDRILDKVRRKVEECDYMEGFQLFHSLAGGSGSGLGSLIMSKIREEYPDKMMATSTLLPSNNDYPTSNYNTVLALHYLVENTDFVTLFNNDALVKICESKLKLENYNYENFNHLITQSICGYTSPFRFTGLLNSSYRKLASNLTPYPRLHFYTVSHSPFCAEENEPTIESLSHDIFDPSFSLLDFYSEYGKYMTNGITYRGEDITNISIIEEIIGKFKRDIEPGLFRNWIPGNFKTSLCKVAAIDGPTKRSATMVSNTTTVKMAFSAFSEKATQLFRRRAFFSSYTQAGMDAMEFTEAESNCNDLICEYYDDWGADCEEEEEEEIE